MKDVMTGTTIIYQEVDGAEVNYKVKDLKDFQRIITLGVEKKIVILVIDGYTADYYWE